MASRPAFIPLTCIFFHSLIIYFIFVGFGLVSQTPTIKNKLSIKTFTMPNVPDVPNKQKAMAAIEGHLHTEFTASAVKPASEIEMINKDKVTPKQKAVKVAAPMSKPKAAKPIESKAKQQALPAKNIENFAKSSQQAEKKKALLQKAKNAIQGMQKAPIQQIATCPLDSKAYFNHPLQDNLTGDSSASKAAYEEELAAILQLLLKLPEHEEIDMALTLSRAGEVISLKILQSASLSNEKYVQEIISKMNFPSFGGEFPGEKEHTFSIKLSVSHL